MVTTRALYRHEVVTGNGEVDTPTPHSVCVCVCARARRANMPIPNLKSLIRELQEAQVAAPETQQKQASTVLKGSLRCLRPFLP